MPADKKFSTGQSVPFLIGVTAYSLTSQFLVLFMPLSNRYLKVKYFLTMTELRCDQHCLVEAQQPV